MFHVHGPRQVIRLRDYPAATPDGWSAWWESEGGPVVTNVGRASCWRCRSPGVCACPDVKEHGTHMHRDLLVCAACWQDGILASARRLLESPDNDPAPFAQGINRALRAFLPGGDSFWIRWRFVGEPRGWLDAARVPG